MPQKYNRYKDIILKNYLQRCKEFESLDKPQAALNVLSEFLTSNKVYRLTFSDDCKLLFLKFLQLSLDLCSSIKLGLGRYRLICQRSSTPHIHMAALFDDLHELLSTSTRLEQNRLSEIYKDRFMQVQYHSKKLNFLWQCFQCAVDAARYLPTTLEPYEKLASLAIFFCGSLGRTNELQSLHENLSSHVTYLAKNKGKKDTIDLTNPETLTELLTVRFNLLESYANLGLFSKTLLVIDEVDVLMSYARSGKNSFSPDLFLAYYELLARIFWDNGHKFLHVVALYHILRISSLNNAFNEEETQQCASELLMATLAVDEDRISEDNKAGKSLEKMNRQVCKILNLFGGESCNWPSLSSMKSLAKEKLSEKENGSVLKFAEYAEDKDAAFKVFAKNVFEGLEELKENEISAEKYISALRRKCEIETLKRCAIVSSRMPIAMLESLLLKPFHSFDILLFQLHYRVDFENKAVVFKKLRGFGKDASELSKKIYRLSEKIYLFTMGQMLHNKKSFEKRKSYFLHLQNMYRKSKESEAEANEAVKEEDVEEDGEERNKREDAAKESARSKKAIKAEKKLRLKKLQQALEKARSFSEKLTAEYIERKASPKEQLVKLKEIVAVGKKSPENTAEKVVRQMKEAENEFEAFAVESRELALKDHDYVHRALKRLESAKWEEKQSDFKKGIAERISGKKTKESEQKEIFTQFYDLIQRQAEEMQTANTLNVNNQNERYLKHKEQRDGNLNAIRNWQKKQKDKERIDKDPKIVSGLKMDSGGRITLNTGDKKKGNSAVKLLMETVKSGKKSYRKLAPLKKSKKDPEKSTENTEKSIKNEIKIDSKDKNDTEIPSGESINANKTTEENKEAKKAEKTTKKQALAKLFSKTKDAKPLGKAGKSKIVKNKFGTEKIDMSIFN